MADRYLLESGAPDGFAIEDGSGVLLLEEGTAAVADDSDSFFSGFQRAVVGIALAAAAVLPVHAAQRVVSQPQDEVPYATGTGIGYGTPQRGFRATNSPKFHLWAQGDDLPVSAAPTIVEETEFQPPVFKTEFKLSGPEWDDQFPRYGIEEDYSWGYWKAEEKVNLLLQSEDSDLPVTPAPTIVEDESFIPWANQPITDSRVWSEGDELPTLTYLDEEGWVPVWRTPSPVFSLWDQSEEIVPQPATTIFSDEGEFQPPVFVPKALFKVWEDTDEWPTPVTSLPFEEDWDYTFLSLDSATYIVWATDEEIIPQPAVSQGGGVGHEEVKVFQWYQGDDFPSQAGGSSGTSSTTNADDTSSATGTTTIVGTSSYTNVNDTSSAVGSPIVNGTSATTNANDTSSASGSVGSAVSGSSATTNNDDTSSANGTTTIVGTSSTTNENDTNSATGTPIVTGSAADTNNNDISTASGISGTPAEVTHTLPMTGAGPS